MWAGNSTVSFDVVAGYAGHVTVEKNPMEGRARAGNTCKLGARYPAGNTYKLGCDCHAKTLLPAKRPRDIVAAKLKTECRSYGWAGR